MKKFITNIILAVILIVCCFSIVACNSEATGDNDFKLVKSISITTNGEQIEFNSFTAPEVAMDSLNSFIDISSSEYYEAPENRRFVGINNWDPNKFSKIRTKNAISRAKDSTLTRYSVVETELKGYWYLKFSYYPDGKVYYQKFLYLETFFEFVYVKVKNDTTVIIKNTDGETTYTVTSFSIVEF